jgi:hypothetical protein
MSEHFYVRNPNANDLLLDKFCGEVLGGWVEAWAYQDLQGVN